MRFSRRRRVPAFAMLVLMILSLLSSGVMAAPAMQGPDAQSPDQGRGGDKGESLIFFTSDGLVQNRVAEYVAKGLLPQFAGLMQKGAYAADNGMLTQAPPNTGAGWYSLATGAWSGVHGSTNNTFHINGAPFTNRTAAFDAGVLQAETLAQAAERGGKKVAQIEWAGGRGANDQRAHGRLPQLLLGPRRGHQLHQPH